MNARRSFLLTTVFLATSFVLLGLSGCRSKVTEENFDEIYSGMSRKDVEKLLGKGEEVKKGDSKLIRWEHNGVQITLTFGDHQAYGPDRVVGKELVVTNSK